MSSFHQVSVPYSPCNNLFRSLFASLTNGGCLKKTLVQSSYQIPFLKTASGAITLKHSCTKVKLVGTLQLPTNEKDTSETRSHLQPEPSTGSSLEQISGRVISAGRNEGHSLQDLGWDLHTIADRDCHSAVDIARIDRKEMRRRRKIGLANKGKTPWNKGRKHSAETRERIMQRTREALRDPKVRRKMSGYPRVHTDQSKARIGTALRRVWGKRLKWKRCQEKCYLKWAQSITEEAKKGGCDQDELQWDSYEKLRAEIVRQHLQWLSDKAKAKEFAKLKARREAKARAEKKARLANEREEKQQKAKAEVGSRRKSKSEERKQGTTILRSLKVKARLTKNYRKNSVACLIASRNDMGNDIEPAVEKWDLEFIRREKMQREVSLADQIEAAKKKKFKLTLTETLKTLSYSSTLDEKMGDYLT